MARVFAFRVQSWLGITSFAVQSFSMDGNLSWYCYFLNSSGAIRVCPDVISWFESRSKSKNRDKLFNYTVRVSVVVPVLELQMLLKAQSFLKSVTIWVQELLILILSRFTDYLVFRICHATQILL